MDAKIGNHSANRKGNAYPLNLTACSIPICASRASHTFAINQWEIIRQAYASLSIPEGIGILTDFTSAGCAGQAIEEGAIGAQSALPVDPEVALVAAAGDAIPVLVGIAEGDNVYTFIEVVVPPIAIFTDLESLLDADPAIPIGS